MIIEEKNNISCAFKQLLCSHIKKKGIFDLSRFYARDNSYNIQKQTRIMAPFGGHTEA